MRPFQSTISLDEARRRLDAAVRLAMERLLIPELGHLVEQAGR